MTERERRVSEQTADLRQERNFVAAVLDTIDALVVVLDTQGRIVRFNQACEQTTGYTFQEVRGKPCFELFLLPEERAAVEQAFACLCAGDSPSKGENYWLTKDGHRRLISWSNTVLLDQEGAVEYVIGTGIDFTERKESEEKLAEERHLLRTLIDNMPDYIYFKDTESKFVTGNQAVAQIMGAETVDALVGKTDFDFYPPELAARYHADEQAIVRSGQPLINKEEPLLDLEGNKRWLSTTKVPLRDNQGKIIGLVGIGRDITERKEMEEEKERLFQKVSQQRERLRALTGQLAEAQEAERKQLAQELHDQVGQNLTGLSLNLNIIRGQIPDSLPEANSIQTRLSDSLLLVEEMGERIEHVMVDLHPPVLDDYGLVAALRWYSRRLIAWVAFNIRVEGQEPEPRLSTPVEHALFRIAQEALTNVAKHARASQVTVSVEVDDDMVRLSIADDGGGFELAVSIEGTGRQGWGLLTMTERAEAVGGRCRIESQAGQGTTVIVEVPR